MPYRRLPNTDKARIRSMRQTIDKMRNDLGYVPVISPSLFAKADRLLNQFTEIYQNYNRCYAEQLQFARSEKYQFRLHNARLYVNDFLLVFNMSVKRGDFKATDREFYGLSQQDGDVPNLSTEVEVLRWCKNAIQGERARMAKGGIPIYNPTIAKLQVHYDLFNDMYQQLQSLRILTNQALKQIVAMRPEMDAVILEMWNSIEKYFSDLSGTERLDKCRQYGVIYYYRKSENAAD